MTRRNKILSWLLAAIVVVGASGSAAAEALRIGGTGAATEMLKHVGAAFAAGS